MFWIGMVVGCLIGGTIGVITMCLIFVTREKGENVIE